MLTCIGVCLADNSRPPEAAEEEEPSVMPSQPELSQLEKLWTRSVFTSHQDTMPVAAPEVKADWAENLSLSGWVELNGRLSAYLVRKDNGEVILIENTAPGNPDDFQLLEIENAGLLLGMRARVRFHGKDAWVTQQAEAEPAIEPTPASVQPVQAPPAPDAPIKAPTTVDSRAARLRPGIVLGAATTFNDSLVESAAQGSEQSPGMTAGTAQPGSTPELPPEQQSNINFIQRLRERHEHRYSSFPRPSGN